jgi:hypothetical protein
LLRVAAVSSDPEESVDEGDYPAAVALTPACCPGEDCTAEGDCLECGTMPREFTLVAAGFTGCPESLINRTWTLTYEEGVDCSFRDEYETADCSGPHTVLARLKQFGGTWIIQFWLDSEATELAQYQLLATAFSCRHASIFYRWSSGGATPPDTLTVTPAGELCEADPGPGEKPCCPGVTLPQTLYATLANDTACACLDGLTVVLGWVPGQDAWQGTVATECTDISGSFGIVAVSVECPGEDWVIRIGFANETPDESASVTVTSCDPVLLSADISTPVMGDCDIVTVTISETPP